jgi:hypothetical protein
VEVAAVLLLQCRHGLGDRALQHGRVLPVERVLERRRGDVLRLRVEGLGDDLLLLGAFGQ